MKLAATLIALLSPLCALAQAPDCSSASALAAAQSRIERTLWSVSQDAGSRQAALGTALQSSAAARGWTAERQGALLQQVLSSPKFMAFEEEKLPHVTALSKAVMAASGPDAQVSRCQAADEVAALARKIAELNARQYQYAAGEIARATRASKR